MSTIHFKDQLREYGEWRVQVVQAIEKYQDWLRRYELGSDATSAALAGTLDSLNSDRIILAFAAEFSRGKTELINALFFADTGIRLLPSAPGRTTMCPTEIFYDAEGGSYIRLLPIESRLNDLSLIDYKRRPRSWMQIELDHTSPIQMQEAFQELAATKHVSVDEAIRLGLYVEDFAADQAIPPDTVEIPCWRHALISFPHYLLKEGLTILDTPGLNALGSEPELTLHMLPSAQAVIFVLAADTGVTKSDLEMWRNHVHRFHQGQRQGLAVVMNKIDSMWGDLQGEEAFNKSIEAQIETTAKILEVDRAAIFPMSAKQALLAKVKGDNALLEKSRLKLFESYLAEAVVRGRRHLMMEYVAKSMGHPIDESARLLESRIEEHESQLTDLRKIDGKNQAMTNQLMDETREQQTRYLASVDSFQATRRVFSVQAKLLGDSLDPEKIEEIIRRTRRQMAGSLTTVGMKAAMKAVLDELRGILHKAVDINEETRKAVKGIYARFHNEHGFVDLNPPLLSLSRYQTELEQIFDEGEAFRNSASSTLMEQSAVVVRLYATTIARARDLFLQAHKETLAWTSAALGPLMQQIKDHKKMIESRLSVLRKVNESSDSLEREIQELEAALLPLRQQYDELRVVRDAIQAPPMEGSSDEETVESQRRVATA